MGRIYKRTSTMTTKEKHKKDEKARRRNVIVNFRMTPEENAILTDRVKLSGVMKQEYMIQSSLHQQVITYGNVKVFDEMKRQIFSIGESVRRQIVGDDNCILNSAVMPL